MVAIGPAHFATVLQELVAKAPNVQKAELVGANDTACVAANFRSGTPEAQALQARRAISARTFALWLRSSPANPGSVDRKCERFGPTLCLPPMWMH